MVTRSKSTAPPITSPLQGNCTEKSVCEGGEGGEGLRWFDMHVIVIVETIALK